jgi:hypothetical protein
MKSGYTNMRVILLLLAIALAFAISPSGAQATLFKDVPTDSWVYGAIDGLQRSGIVDGYPESPGRTFTRYECAMVVSRIYSKLDDTSLREKVTAEQATTILALAATFQRELEQLGVNMKEPMEQLANEKLFQPAIGNHPSIKPPRAALFEDVPYPYWSWDAISELKKAVGFQVYPDLTPPGPLTRYEMAMQINSVYEELEKPIIRAQLSVSDTRLLFALTSEYAPEFCFLNNESGRWISTKQTIVWLAKSKTLRVPLGDADKKHASYGEIPKGGWVFHATDNFIREGILEGHLSTEPGHGGTAEQAYTGYEIAFVTARIYTMLGYGYYTDLTDADILRLLALSSEFASELDAFSFEFRPTMFALLEARLFQPER